MLRFGGEKTDVVVSGHKGQIDKRGNEKKEAIWTIGERKRERVLPTTATYATEEE
jgi:hypothetical protein